jgi:hypothetical protein
MNVKFLAFNAYCCQVNSLRISLLLSFLLAGGIAVGQIKIDLPYSPSILQPEQINSLFNSNIPTEENARLNLSEINHCSIRTEFNNNNAFNTPASINESNSVTYNWFAFNNLFNQIDSTVAGYRFANNRDKKLLQSYYKTNSSNSIPSCWTVNSTKTGNFPASYPAIYFDKNGTTFRKDSMYSNHTILLIQTLQSFYFNSKLPYKDLANQINSSDKSKFKTTNQLVKESFEKKQANSVNLIARALDENFTVTWKGDFTFTSSSASFTNFSFHSNIILDTEEITKLTEELELDLNGWAEKSYFVATHAGKSYRLPYSFPIEFSFQKQSSKNVVFLDKANQSTFNFLLNSRYTRKLLLPARTKLHYSTFSTELKTSEYATPLESNVSRVMSIELPSSYGALPAMALFGRGYKLGVSGYRQMFDKEQRKKRCATQKFMVIGFTAGTLSGLTRIFANSLYNEDPVRYKNSPNVADISKKIITGSCILYSTMIVIDFSRTLHLVKTTKRKITAINSMLDENVIYSN